MAKRQRHLPMEIAEIIRLKLPPKSLLRFQTLSKSYMTMIRDPCFSRIHLELSRKNNTSSFLIKSPKDEGYYCLAKFEDGKFRPEKEVGRLPVGSRYCPMCYCDDTVLFARMMKNRNIEYLLWNPINNTHRAIKTSFDQRPRTCGLCHDKTEDDYKIVLVCCVKTYVVYSCKHGTWTAMKKVEDECHLLNFTSARSGVFIDGKLYWVGHGGDREWGIINFDPLSESLNEIEIPLQGFGFRYYPFLVNLRGCVCFGGDVKLKDVIQIWMLRGGSWEKTICIDKRLWLNHKREHVTACYVIGDDEIVIYTSDGNYITNTLEDRLLGRCSIAPFENQKTYPRPLVLSLRSFF